MRSQKGLRKTVTRGLPEHRILLRWKAVSLCRVGNHVFLHVCRAVEIDFCLELLYMTIVCLIKPENSLAPGSEREGHDETVVLQGYPPAAPWAHQPLDFSCPCIWEWEEEYEAVGRHSNPGLARMTLTGDKLHAMKETCFCTPPRCTQPIPIASTRAEALSGRGRWISLVKKIFKALNPLFRIQVFLIGPSPTTGQRSELDFFFSFQLKNGKKKKKCLCNHTATALTFVKSSLSCCVPQCRYLWNGYM